VSEPSNTSPALRAARVAVLLGLPLLVLLGAAWFAAHSAARIWPSPDTPALDSLAPVLPGCDDGEQRLQALLRVAELPAVAEQVEVEPPADADSVAEGFELALHPVMDEALDALLACDGLQLDAGRGTRIAEDRLGEIAALRLARAVERGQQGELVASAADLASVLRLSALLEHAGGDLALTGAGVAIGIDAVDATEFWLLAHPAAPEDALAVLAQALEALAALPAGAPHAMVRECRDRENHLRNLGSIPAPAMMLEPAGVPLWAGWAADLLPGARIYDAPHTLAMHRHRCTLRLDAVEAGGLASEAELGPVLWTAGQLAIGPLLDNPLGRVTLSEDDLSARADLVIQQGSSLRTRRALLRVRVALERGSRAHDGLLPSHLQLLVPDFLPELPVDPVDGKLINWVRSTGEVFTTREVVGPDGTPRRLMTRVPER